MPNYQNAKIYKIMSHLRPDLVYIGATTRRLSERLGEHNRRKGCSSKHIIEIGDAYIELVEAFPCQNKEELSRREGQYIRANTCVNKCIPGRTQAEYRKDNPEYHKQYYEANAEKIKQRARQYHKDNPERQKQYNKDNAERIKEKNTKIDVCPCGVKYQHQSKIKHVKSKNHQRYVMFMNLTEEQVNKILE